MNDLTMREAAIIRFALRMLDERIGGEGGREYHLTGGGPATNIDLAISKRECRLLVGKVS